MRQIQLIILLFAIALTKGDEVELNENGCPVDPYIELLLPHRNCNKFYQCRQGELAVRICPKDLVFNVDKWKCDWPFNVECGDREVSDNGNSDNDDQGNDNENNENEDGGNGASDNNEVNEEEEDSNGAGNSDPSEAPAICAAEGSDGVLVAHENCGQFYKCDNGVPVAMKCYGDLVFNPQTDKCDWAENVECGDREVSDNGNSDNDDQGSDNENNENEDGGNGGSDNNEVNEEEGDSNGAGNSDPSEAPAICAAEGSDGVLVAHENCGQFYKCDNGVPVAMKCYGDLVFNPQTDKCDWAENVECGDREVSDNGNSDNDDQGSDNENNENEDGGNGGSDNNEVNEEEGDSNGAGNSDPSEAPAICAAEGSDGVLVAHENCGQFYKCDNGVPVAMKCYGDLVFNSQTDKCDWAENVECGDREVSDNGNSDNDDQGSDNENNENEDGGNGGSDNNEVNEEEGDSNGAGNSDPSEAPAICAAEGSDGVLVAHENCGQFYKCDNGVPVAMKCYGDLVFNPQTDKCDWAENVECGDREVSDNGNSDNDDQGSDNENNENEDGGNSGSDNNEVNEEEGDSNGAGNSDPSEAPAICAAEGSDGVLVAHENCGQFYKCDNGVPVAMKCYGDLVFNPQTDKCDWAENVECGDREVSDNGNSDNDDQGNDNENNENEDSGNGGSDNNEVNEEEGDSNGAGNSDPSEAPAICAAEGSDGVLVAHENCGQFYKCDNGVPVAMKCYGDLVFNPQTDKCDWAENVECGDREVSDNGNSDNDDQGSDNENNENEDGGNSGSDNNEVNEEEGDSNGAGNSDPSEAPAICAAEGSDGVLVAHGNCGQFYKCDNGVPVAMKCYGDLVFNPQTDKCDWAENVECGDREVSDNGNSDNDDQGNDNENNENEDSGNGGSDNNEVNEEEGDSNGAGNSDPSEAPAICAAEGSDGVLVAHENCGQFYKCDNGVPVAMKCYGDLVFNPQTDKCDWAKNVECGDREVSDNGNSDNDDQGSDNENNENEDGGNSGSDNNEVNEEEGDSNGAGNSDPSEAPAICAAEGSDGVLIAHENCGQFYKCDNGVPVAMKCYGDLVFNPQTDKCDWAENVECGDREVSDNGNSDNDDQGSDNENNENEDGGNSGSDNNEVNEEEGDSNGAGNSDPSEAPAICAAEGSDGVLVAHENCGQFYKCDNGVPVAMKCYGDLVFNPQTDKCDWAENVECGDREVPDNGNSDNDDQGSDNENNENEDGGNGGSDNNEVNEEEEDSNGAGNSDPSEAPAICAAEGSDGVLVAHENCGQFYKCDNGVPVAMKCYGDLVFNPQTNKCDWAENVECGDREVSDNGNSDNDDQGSDNENNENEDGGNSGSDNNEVNEEEGDSNGAGNSDPSEAPAICAAEGSDGVLIAHENCGQFYKCDNGVPVAMKCYGDLVFNPQTDKCDWAENVECGDREVSDNGNSDNDDQGSDNENNENEDGGNGGSDNNEVNEEEGDSNGAGNSDPSEAPAICAAEGSDGVLVAHENCGQFYKCDNGVPVAMKCYGDLVFNPQTDKCDWAENVECGDREVSDNGNSDNDDQGNGDGDSVNVESEDNKTEEGQIEEDDDVENGNINEEENNIEPEAYALCADYESHGLMLPHKKCNQFYTCLNGKPVVLICQPTLLYNPNEEKCDYPENVDCGNRVIPNSEIVITEEDSGMKFSTASAFCAREGTDNLRITHELCDKYYVCVRGLPWTLNCQPGLRYNTKNQRCDLPKNVLCGKRNLYLH